jgi:hypothetical protein
MKHPNEEELLPLLQKLDTAIWAWEVNKQSRRKGQVNWKGAIDELSEAYQAFQVKQSDLVAVPSEGVLK